MSAWLYLAAAIVLETTGTFTMGASTSARFLANATSTFEAVNWNGGAAGTPVWLRSSATGTQWRFTSDTLVTSSYANVRDSFNASVATATCSVGCTDAGNNTRWDFSTGTQQVAGTLTLSAHPSGQADNLFSFQNQDDGLFYRFSLTAGPRTYTDLEFRRNYENAIRALGGVKINTVQYTYEMMDAIGGRHALEKTNYAAPMSPDSPHGST